MSWGAEKIRTKFEQMFKGRAGIVNPSPYFLSLALRQSLGQPVWPESFERLWPPRCH